MSTHVWTTIHGVCVDNVHWTWKFYTICCYSNNTYSMDSSNQLFALLKWNFEYCISTEPTLRCLLENAMYTVHCIATIQR